MRCLYCHDYYQPVPTWASFLKPDFNNGFCAPCMDKMERIEEKLLCRVCGRDLISLEASFKSRSERDLCLDCERWEAQSETGIYKNRSLYLYNDFMKELIARYKFRGDPVLAEGFRAPLREVCRKQFRSFLLVPVPLSEKRLQERCFNQAEHLAALLPGKITPLLLRTIHSPKQSKKSRQERISMAANPFMINPAFGAAFHNKKLLIIDDIYTTGTTVRQAAKALAPLNPEQVCSLTLARAK